VARGQRERNLKKGWKREKEVERHEDSKKGKTIESEIKSNCIVIDMSSRLNVQQLWP
jgi:hypothetical protein